MMKKLTYCVTFSDNTKVFEEVEAADVVEGHWKIHRKYEGCRVKTYWVHPMQKIAKKSRKEN